MNRGNFTAKDNFPVSTFTYDFLQKMSHLAGNLAQLGGQNYILSGCVMTGTTVSAGLIVINGEILPFEGGTKKAKITIQETVDTDHFNGIDYTESYIHRSAKFASNGEYNWSDFVRVLTNKELEEKINLITGDVPGTVKMWAGQVAKIPADYMLCDGSVLLNTDYPELYENLGGLHGTEGTTGFKLPDMRDRFVVGYNNQNSDYDIIGHKGGYKEITLTVDQMPSHTHQFPGVRTDSNNWRGTGEPVGSWTVYGDTKSTQSTGGNKAHENRPPYFVIAYIIKVK